MENRKLPVGVALLLYVVVVFGVVAGRFYDHFGLRTRKARSVPWRSCTHHYGLPGEIKNLSTQTFANNIFTHTHTHDDTAHDLDTLLLLLLLKK